MGSRAKSFPREPARQGGKKPETTFRDFFPSSRLRGGLGPVFTTKTRRRKESPSFWLRLSCSVFIGGFILWFLCPYALQGSWNFHQSMGKREVSPCSCKMNLMD